MFPLPKFPKSRAVMIPPLTRILPRLFQAILLATWVSFTLGWQPAAQASAPNLPASYPPDPNDEIPWSSGTAGVADIQAAFNYARAQENAQLGGAIPTIPPIAMPPQSIWDQADDAHKALWLVNRERIDRGVKPLYLAPEANVTSVAVYYANYLLSHNAFSHTADGNNPWQRLNTNPAINACHDFLNVAENLAAFWASPAGTVIPLPVERSIYGWMYEDESDGNNWGHRHAILWYPYNDNSGLPDMEGFFGLGRASGPHMGWPVAEIVVMNVFDPCASWSYPTFSSHYLPLASR